MDVQLSSLREVERVGKMRRYEYEREDSLRDGQQWYYSCFQKVGCQWRARSHSKDPLMIVAVVLKSDERLHC